MNYIKFYAPYLLILIFVLFFIYFRWNVIDLLWEGRITPPEPDDSFVYIASTRIIGDSGSFFFDLKYIFPWTHNNHLLYLPWSANMAIVSIIGDFSYFDVYKANFYFGIVLLSFIILYMLNVLERDKLFWIFGISFLTLYLGSGYYHGFFWVVPSFYSLAATFLLISLIFDTNRILKTPGKSWCLLFFLIALLTIWSHPLGKLSYFAIVSSYIIYIILNKLFLGNSIKILLKRALILIACGSIIIFSLEVLPYLMGIDPSSQYSLPGVVQQIGEDAGNYNLFNTLYLEYFRFNSYGFILLATGLFSILVSKKTSLFSLYFGFLIVSFISSSLSELGHRILVYLWPITFIIYAYGFYFLFRKMIDAYKTKHSKMIKIKLRLVGISKDLHLTKDFIMLLIIIILVSINSIFPFAQENYDLNINYANYKRDKMSDWRVDPSVIDYINNVTNSGDLLIFADVNAFMTISSLGILDREMIYANYDWNDSYIFLHEKVNGSYLISTDAPEITLLNNIIEAFENKLTFSFIKNFGILNIYQVTVEQFTYPYPFIYKGIEMDLITDDFQTGFWSKSQNLELVNNNETRVIGENSLQITLSQYEKDQNDHFWHKYDTLQNWSSKDFLIFDWYGAGSSKNIEILIYAPDGSNRFVYTFKDDSIGWTHLIIPLNSFKAVNGIPSWSRIGTIYFRFSINPPYTETFYLDQLALDVEPRVESKTISIVAHNSHIFSRILPAFFLLLFLPGLMWALIIFRVRNLIALIGLSFGLSFILLFLLTFLLNLTTGLCVSSTSIVTIFIITIVFPPILHYFKRFLRIIHGEKN